MAISVTTYKIYIREKLILQFFIIIHTTGSRCQQGLNHVGLTNVCYCLILFITWPDENDQEVNLPCLTSCTDTRGLCCQDFDTGLLQDLRRGEETQSS